MPLSGRAKADYVYLVGSSGVSKTPVSGPLSSSDFLSCRGKSLDMVEQGERAHCSPRNGLSTLPHLAGAELQDPRIYGHRAGGRLHRFSSYLLHLSLLVPAPKRKEHLGNVSGAGALGQKQVQPPLTQDGLLSGYLSFWLSTFSRLIHPATARWLSCSFEKKIIIF